MDRYDPGPGPENHAPNLPAAPAIEHGQLQEVRHPPNGGKSAPGGGKAPLCMSSVCII